MSAHEQSPFSNQQSPPGAETTGIAPPSVVAQEYVAKLD